jgi:hypothetical protein
VTGCCSTSAKGQYAYSLEADGEGYTVSPKENDGTTEFQSNLIKGDSERLNVVHSVSQSADEGKEKSSGGCDAGFGLLALLPFGGAQNAGASRELT